MLLATSLLTTAASSQSAAFDIRARDSTATIHAFSEANRVGVSMPSPDRKATDGVGLNLDPTTECVVGYVALAAGVIAVTIFVIGFYKLGRLLAH